MPMRPCRTWSRFRPATRCSPSWRISTSPRRPPPQPSPSRRLTRKWSTIFFEYLDFALQFAPPGPEEKNPRQAGPYRHWRRQDFRLQRPRLNINLAGLGMKDGEKKVEAAVAGTGKGENGWLVGGLA